MKDLQLESGLAFDRPLEGDGDVESTEIPAGKAVELRTRVVMAVP